MLSLSLESVFTSLNKTADIYVAFGTGNFFTYWHINTICHKLGEKKSLALPFFSQFHWL